jgi:hypothetical protein
MLTDLDVTSVIVINSFFAIVHYHSSRCKSVDTRGVDTTKTQSLEFLLISGALNKFRSELWPRESRAEKSGRLKMDFRVLLMK